MAIQEHHMISVCFSFLQNAYQRADNFFFNISRHTNPRFYFSCFGCSLFSDIESLKCYNSCNVLTLLLSVYSQMTYAIHFWEGLGSSMPYISKLHQVTWHYFKKIHFTILVRASATNVQGHHQ